MEKITKAVTAEQIQARRDEIINSCYKVYLEKGFKETSIKDISLNLSFARSSIYNYYQTKEEIFLDLLTSEYYLLCQDLDLILNKEKVDINEFALLVSTTFSKRKTLLQIISTSLRDLEEYSRIEHLINFKKSYGLINTKIEQLLIKFFKYDEKKVDLFIELFFPFLFGMYVFTFVSEKQMEAMRQANIKFVARSSEELCSDFIINFLNNN